MVGIETMTWFMTARIVLLLTGLIGVLGELAYFLFLFLRPFGWTDLGFRNDITSVAFDCLLSFIFFIQHSGMVRRSFKARLLQRWKIPKHYHCTVYCAASGVTLMRIVPLWQQTNQDVLLSIRGYLRVLSCIIFVACVAGMCWGLETL